MRCSFVANMHKSNAGARLFESRVNGIILQDSKANCRAAAICRWLSLRQRSADVGLRDEPLRCSKGGNQSRTCNKHHGRTNDGNPSLSRGCSVVRRERRPSGDKRRMIHCGTGGNQRDVFQYRQRQFIMVFCCQPSIAIARGRATRLARRAISEISPRVMRKLIFNVKHSLITHSS